MMPAAPPETPALQAWRSRQGRFQPDALWAAACWERSGLERASVADLERARQIVAARIGCRLPRCEHSGSDCLWHLERAYTPRGGAR